MWLTIVIVLVVCLLISSSGAGGFFWYTKKLDAALSAMKEGVYTCDTPSSVILIAQTSVPGVVAATSGPVVFVITRRWGKLVSELHEPVNSSETYLKAPSGFKRTAGGPVTIEGDVITLKTPNGTSAVFKYTGPLSSYPGPGGAVEADSFAKAAKTTFTKFFEDAVANPPK